MMLIVRSATLMVMVMVTCACVVHSSRCSHMAMTRMQRMHREQNLPTTLDSDGTERLAASNMQMERTMVASRRKGRPGGEEQERSYLGCRMPCA
jgi:hypothetical protein